jgi:hypothetical protein
MRRRFPVRRRPRSLRCPHDAPNVSYLEVGITERSVVRGVVAPKRTDTPQMPQTASVAAVAAFQAIIRERSPGLRLLRLEGPDGSVVASSPGQVVRPFAAPEDRDALLDRDAAVAAADDDRVDRGGEDALALGDG